VSGGEFEPYIGRDGTNSRPRCDPVCRAWHPQVGIEDDDPCSDLGVSGDRCALGAAGCNPDGRLRARFATRVIASRDAGADSRTSQAV